MNYHEIQKFFSSFKKIFIFNESIEIREREIGFWFGEEVSSATPSETEALIQPNMGTSQRTTHSIRILITHF